MNSIQAFAIAKSIQQDRLDAAARRRRPHRPAQSARAPRRTYFGEMVRALLIGFRHKPHPSR